MQQNKVMIQSHTAIEDSNDYRFQKGLKAEKPTSMVSYSMTISDSSCQSQLCGSMFLILQSAEKYQIMFNQRQQGVHIISSAFNFPAQSVGRKSMI